jgi:hypothetical protein
LQESALDGFATIRLKEDPEDLVVHLPTVHDFLVFHTFFGDEDVDGFGVGQGTVAFEPLADDMANVGWRDVKSIEGTYFWGLESWVSFTVRLGMVVGLTERYQSR